MIFTVIGLAVVALVCLGGAVFTFGAAVWAPNWHEKIVFGLLTVACLILTVAMIFAGWDALDLRIVHDGQ